MKEKAEISLQPNGYILIKRIGKKLRPYNPTEASRERVYTILDKCPQLFSGWYIFRGKK